MDGTSATDPAGFWEPTFATRLLARVVDALILLAVWGLPGVIGLIVVPPAGVLSFIPLVVFVFVFVFALRPPLHQGLHDLAANAVVTRVLKPAGR